MAKRIFCIMFLLLLNLQSYGEDEKTAVKPAGTDVLLNGRVIFQIYSASAPFSLQQRSEAISARIAKIISEGNFREEDLDVVGADKLQNIRYRGSVIMSVSESDAVVEGKSAAESAEQYMKLIKAALKTTATYTVVDEPADIYNFIIKKKDLLIRIGISILSFIILLVILFLTGRLFRKIHMRLENNSDIKLKGIKFRNYEVIGRETILSTLSLILKGVRLFISVMIFYLYVNLLFSIFPWADYTLARDLFTGSLLTVFTVAIWFGIYRTVKVFFNFMKNNIQAWKGTLIRPLIIKKITIMTDEQIVSLIRRGALLLEFLTNLFLLYIFIPIVFSYFEFTRTWADILFGYVLAPLKTMTAAFIAYLPSLVFIAVIVMVNRYLTKLSSVIFREIKYGTINIPGFHSEWADPTHKIVRFLIIIFTVIVIYPYLPGSSSDAFKGISIFLGVLFSLGSTSIIANVVAGLILTYMYAFRMGDRVKIGETTGDVVEKTLLVTRIRTVKNVIVTIPNSMIMSSQIINYSSSLSKENLILHTSVTLGYDVPWRLVHETLITAAGRSENLLKEPAPFVLQTGLDDYYVRYELNAYTDDPHSMARAYSQLHQNIQDSCNEAGIEILSPRYDALRDGNRTAIPEGYLKDDYVSPGFNFKGEIKKTGESND